MSESKTQSTLQSISIGGIKKKSGANKKGDIFGKLVDGKFVPNAAYAAELKLTRVKKTTDKRQKFDHDKTFGTTALLTQAAETSGLTDDLKKVYGEGKAAMMVSLRVRKILWVTLICSWRSLNETKDRPLDSVAGQILENAKKSGLEINTAEDAENLMAHMLGRLLTQMLDGEMTNHLGYERGGKRVTEMSVTGIVRKPSNRPALEISVLTYQRPQGRVEPRVVPSINASWRGFEDKVWPCTPEGSHPGNSGFSMMNTYGDQCRIYQRCYGRHPS
ncbi:hypothetical protein [Mesosutterella multiformis]|uniref:hypothetical protein n=1 Tax=Mesosutterella multiformis TaxID=2259133 RepID=UPI000E2A129C|nr:hypothetical protein [Mesosutterella multiformis]